jgi:NTE family protein
MDPKTDIIRLFRHGTLHAKARELAERLQPKIPFGLTIAEVPRLRLHVVSEGITWQHLAAACTIPLVYRPVRIGGKYYVDGGLLGALPLWAAEQMGATEAIALNCLKDWPFRFFRAVLPVPEPSPKMRVTLIEPERPLASLQHAVRWSARNVDRWIAQGERDGNRALSWIRM